MGIKLKRFFKDEGGASMVEYAVALLVVTAVGVTFMTTLGNEVGDNVVDACAVLQNNTTSTCS